VVSGLTDDFSLANEVTQRGFGIIWGHQLTGHSSLSLSLNEQRSLAKGTNAVDTKTQGAYLLFSTQLSPKTQANIGARHVVSDGGGQRGLHGECADRCTLAQFLIGRSCTNPSMA
jgi:hypothetical protein